MDAGGVFRFDFGSDSEGGTGDGDTVSEHVVSMGFPGLPSQPNSVAAHRPCALVTSVRPTLGCPGKQ